MLFSQMPLWLFATILALCFLLKQVISDRFQSSAYYIGKTEGLGWTAALNTKAAMNGMMTTAIFFPFAGANWSLILGLIDAAFHWLSGYYAIKKKLPTIDKAELMSAVNAIRALHGGSYLVFIDIVLQYVMPLLTGAPK